jgi:hypothetical protein
MKSSLLFLLALFGVAIAMPNTRPDPSRVCPVVEQIWGKYCQNTTHLQQFCGMIDHIREDFCNQTNREDNFCPQFLENTAKFKAVNFNLDQFCLPINLFTEQLESYWCARYTHIDPSDFCPLIKIVDDKFCESMHTPHRSQIDPTKLCPLIEFIDKVLCTSSSRS